jgi:hypothetical protein
MVNLWMPEASKHSVGNTGTMSGGPSRVVWHTTSNTNDHTFANELGWFTGGGADVAPHLLWDPFTGEIAQLFPADSRSLSLQNDGTVKTNRTGKYCIQIEIVFTAGETVAGKAYKTVAETPCKNLDKILAWTDSLGISRTWVGGAPKGLVRETVSLTTWLNDGGMYGHNKVPGNSHVDPGVMPNLAKVVVTPPTTTPAKPTTPKPYTPPAFPTGLKPNNSTPSAKTLQKALKATSWLDQSVVLSDNYGSQTQVAVAGFNKKHNLNSAGKTYDPTIGPKGWKLLFTLAYGA